MDAMELLNGCIKQVVIARRDTRLPSWANWLREDLWLWPDFVVVKDHVAQTSRILVEPHLIAAEFRKAWMPFFCRAGHPEVTVTQFLAFVGSFLPQEAEIDLPPISGRELMEVARAKKSTCWMVGPGMRLKPYLFLGFLGTILLNLTDAACHDPQGRCFDS